MIVLAMREELKLVPEDLAGEPMLITGPGAVNVIRALKDVPRAERIYNFGYVGSNVLPVGARCRIGKVAMYHPAAGINDRTFMLDGDVPCYTAGDFVTHTEITEPCVFDMELAVILALGFHNVTSLKIVSDNLSTKEFEECLKK